MKYKYRYRRKRVLLVICNSGVQHKVKRGHSIFIGRVMSSVGTVD
ncbi:MAG: hypothetical protein RLY14_3341, partial [Planctomycetota bacterium]